MTFLRFSRCIQYFNKNILLLNMIGDETFNIMLTNNVVSFEQLGLAINYHNLFSYGFKCPDAIYSRFNEND